MSLGHLTGSFMSGLLLSQFIFNVSLTVYVSKFIWKNGACILYRDRFLNTEDMRDTQLNKISLYMIRFVSFFSKCIYISTKRIRYSVLQFLAGKIFVLASLRFYYMIYWIKMRSTIMVQLQLCILIGVINHRNLTL